MEKLCRVSKLLSTDAEGRLWEPAGTFGGLALALGPHHQMLSITRGLAATPQVHMCFACRMARWWGVHAQAQQGSATLRQAEALQVPQSVRTVSAAEQACLPSGRSPACLPQRRLKWHSAAQRGAHHHYNRTGTAVCTTAPTL